MKKLLIAVMLGISFASCNGTSNVETVDCSCDSICSCDTLTVDTVTVDSVQ